jgi:hypothetical protein
MIVTATLWVIIGLLVLFVGGSSFIVSLINKQNTTHSMENKTKAIDIFLYLGIFISLITSVVNILEIIFTAVDKKFVDVLTSVYSYDIYNDSMRMAIASLMVMFPVYLFISWYVSRDITKFLYKRDILVRKIMIYVALFVTVLTLVGTLVTLIYTYLGGELSVRFELKALSVFVIALAVFSYYFYSLRRDYTKKTFVPLVIGVVASIVVVLSLVWSISVIGTPSEMRAKKIDSTRLSDISRLQQEVLNRFNSVEKIPADLSELNNAFQSYAVPLDPVTKLSYGYKVIQQPTFKVNYTTNKKELVTPAIFELCATFETVRSLDERGKTTQPVSVGTGGMDVRYSAMNSYYDGDISPFWNHGIGETCFKRIISAEMYYGK